MKNIGILLVLIFVTFVAGAQPMPINSKSMLVIDADTDDIILSKNSDEIKSIASITKLMTGLIIVDTGLALDEMITITNDDVVGTKLRGVETSNTLQPGSTLSRAQLLHLALMNSQNRAAYALARSYPAGYDIFVSLMNIKATELGMEHTNFVDPTGLQTENKSTALDLTKLVKAVSTHTMLRDFSTSTSFETTQYFKKRSRLVKFGTTNKLLTKTNWAIDLQKTGYIKNAGRCMVVMTTIGTRRIIIVLLDSESPHDRAIDAISIKYWLEHNEVASSEQLRQLDIYKYTKPSQRHSNRSHR